MVGSMVASRKKQYDEEIQRRGWRLTEWPSKIGRLHLSICKGNRDLSMSMIDCSLISVRGGPQLGQLLLSFMIGVFFSTSCNKYISSLHLSLTF
jgi:hypothetical protein